MGGGKGCAVGAALAGVFGLILGLIMLFAMASGAQGGAGGAGGALGGTLNFAKVPAQYLAWVEKAGTQCPAVSAPLIAAQIKQESGWDPNAVSPAGAQGIAQFMPGTWSTWGVAADGVQPPSPFDAADGIVSMAVYDCALAADVAKVSGDPVSNMLAAYNAGPAAVLQYQGIPPFAETQAYVRNILVLVAFYSVNVSSSPGTFAAAEIAAAEKWVGTPYVWGGGSYSGPTTGLSGTTPGFDCSGLLMYAVYVASHGTIQLPHSSETDATLGTEISPVNLQPGDLIAIQTEGPGDYSHIVIYVGGGEVVEAPKTGQNVKIAPLADFAGMTQTIRRLG